MIYKTMLTRFAKKCATVGSIFLDAFPVRKALTVDLIISRPPMNSKTDANNFKPISCKMGINQAKKSFITTPPLSFCENSSLLITRLSVFYARKTPSMKILIPIISRIEPPKIDALPASFVPKVLPKRSPIEHRIKVTMAMTRQQTSAINQS